MAVVSRCLRAAFLSSCALATGAYAQSSPTPDFVVTATRTPQAISRAGSAITVITAEEIAKESPKSVVDLLRRAPGVTAAESGGPGGKASVFIRGAESRHTLVLVDGVRVNDPSQPGNEFDFATIVLTDIERIEVLRGPQSALYGSDAMGGVINIITRKGKGAPRFSASTEAGSYSTKSARAAVSGQTGPLSFAFSLTGYDTAGFSRYGYRIGRIERALPWPLEADAARRLGASGRVGIALSDSVELDIGGYIGSNRTQFDAVFGEFPDTDSQSEQLLLVGHTRLTALTLDGMLRHTILLSANRNDRDSRETYYFFGENRDRYAFQGDRVAAEYQGDLKLGSFGLLTFGTKVERERLLTEVQPILPFAGPFAETQDASALTQSVFALHQVSLFENLHLSLGGRIDRVRSEGGRPGAEEQVFPTWRATLAYEIPQTGTTLRTSIGTGAKAPSLYQQFGPNVGTPGLRPEYSLGMDVGIDQRLFDDRVVLSTTLFSNHFRDLIEFSLPNPAVCPPANTWGCYVNIARAETSGLELAADMEFVPSWLRLKLAYTHLRAFDRSIDEITGLPADKHLARRPEHQVRAGFAFTPLPGLSIEPSVLLVGERFSDLNEGLRLAPYARFDLYADYRINDTFSIFARAENLTDAEYQDIYNYGTAGRSFYAGIRATW